MLEVRVVVLGNLEAMHTLVVVLCVDPLPSEAIYSHALSDFSAAVLLSDSDRTVAEVHCAPSEVTVECSLVEF